MPTVERSHAQELHAQEAAYGARRPRRPGRQVVRSHTGVGAISARNERGDLFPPRGRSSAQKEPPALLSRSNGTPSTCSTLHVPAPSDASTRHSCEPSEGERASLMPFHGAIHSIRAERPTLVCPPPQNAAGLKAARLHRRGQHGALRRPRIGYNRPQQPAARMRTRAIRSPCRVVHSHSSWCQCLREARLR